MLIVCPAEKPNARNGGLPTARHGFHVIEFQASPRLTALTALAHERALSAVALEDGTLDCGRDQPGVRTATPWAGSSARRELLLLQLLNQHLQCTLDHLRDVAGRHRVAQQRLRLAKQVVRAAGDGHLQRESLGREGGDAGSGRK
jgi:hypothetical protein